ncbi:MAG: response regulator [Rhizomicrobium sp.]|jgi:CheY-like chemotaxis protein
MNAGWRFVMGCTIRGGKIVGGGDLFEVFLSRHERAPAILVVDDEELIRATVSEHLTECGFEVLAVANAAEAIEILESDEAQIDLVFSDIQMPGDMDGIGLAMWLKAHRPELPLLLTSGQIPKLQAARDLCEKEPFLIKPYPFQPLAHYFMRLIELRNK